MVSIHDAPPFLCKFHPPVSSANIRGAEIRSYLAGKELNAKAQGSDAFTDYKKDRSRAIMNMPGLYEI
jgi:hypothetical protein